MDELTDIYKRIEYLRNNGVKMKEIADRVDMACLLYTSHPFTGKRNLLRGGRFRRHHHPERQTPDL